MLPDLKNLFSESELEYRELTAYAPDATNDRVAGLEIYSGVGRVDMLAIIVPGLFKNTSDRWIAATLKVQLFDGAGQPLGLTETFGVSDYYATPYTFAMAPGAVSPFCYLVEKSDVQGSPAGFQIQLLRVVFPEYRPLAEISEVQFTPGESCNATVAYRMTNVGTEPIAWPQVGVVGYDAADRIYVVEPDLIRDAQGESPDILQPGESGTSAYLIGDTHAEQIVRVEVYPGNSPPAGTSGAPNHAKYNPQASRFHEKGERFALRKANLSPFSYFSPLFSSFFLLNQFFSCLLQIFP